MARTDDFITEARGGHAKALFDAVNSLVALQAEWDALDYTNTLPDGSGANSGYTKAEVSAVVNTTADAIVTLFGQGHGTNIAKLL